MVKLKSHSKETELTVSASTQIENEYLVVNYRIDGNVADIVFPLPVNENFRRYDLWEHTCFEMFIKRPEDNWYLEFNFASSRSWNCFFLSSYRSNEGEYVNVQEVLIDQDKTENSYELVAKIHLSQLEAYDFKEDVDFQVGLTAVIESADGTLGHWSINRLEDKPDFHHGDTFINYRFGGK